MEFLTTVRIHSGMPTSSHASTRAGLARHALVTLLLALSTTLLRAQDAGASLTGLVRDTAGAPIHAASVELLHQPTGYRIRATTNAAGRFAIFGLPLGGPVTLTVRRLGYQLVERTGLQLTIGAQPALTLILRGAGSALATVEVRDRRDDGREARIGGSTRISRERVDALPVIDRDFAGLTALAPLAGAQLSLGGQRWTSTDIRLDGAQHRNMLRAGEANGGPAAVPMDAVREFEVNTAVFDVAQGRQGGGQIAAATRSGANVAEGRLFSSYRSEQLAAATDFQGRSRTVRQATVRQSGVSVGGPIVRDRAHFFIAYERQDSDEPLFTGDVSTPRAQQAAGINADSLARVLSILARRYGTDTALAQLGRLDRGPLSQTVLGRVDWQLTPTTRATVRGTASRWSSPLSGGVDQAIALREARSDFRSDESQIAATLSSGLGSASNNELQLTYNGSTRELTPAAPGVPRGFVQVRSVLPDGTTGNTTIQFGGNRLAPDQSNEWAVELRDRLTAERGRWLFTVGTDNTLTGTRTLIAESQSGLFVFPSIAALDALTPNRFTRTVPLAGSSPETRQHVLELGVFSQAVYRANARLTVSGGIRWDATQFLTAPARNAAVDSTFGVNTARAPSDWHQIQPRAQVVWSVDDAGRDVVRVGAGRFSAQLPYYAQHNQLLYTGTSLADIDLRGAAAPTPDFAGYRGNPASVPGLGTAALPPAYVNIVGAWHAPRVDKTIVAWEHHLTDTWTTTLGAQYSRTSQEYQYVDRNLRASPSFTLDNEGGRGVWVPAATIPAATGVTDVRNASANPAFARVVALESNASGTQLSFTGESALQLGRIAQATVGYAWSRARDNSTYGCCLARTATTFTPITDDPRNLSQAWGPSDLSTRHRIVGTLLTKLPFGISAAARYVGASGRPFSLVVDGDINGDEANGNDLAFLFDPKSPGTDAAVAASMTRLLANPNNVAAQYIAAHLGSIAQRNAIATPWTHRVDLRLARPIHIARSTRVELTLDVFNVGNLLNSNWGAQYLLPLGISSQNPVVNRVPLLRVTGFDAVTKRYKYTVNESAGVFTKGGDPYQLQLGARLGW